MGEEGGVGETSHRADGVCYRLLSGNRNVAFRCAPVCHTRIEMIMEHMPL